MKHFNIGQVVWEAGKRYQIMAYPGAGRVVLMPLDESGPIRVVHPYYTQGEQR